MAQNFSLLNIIHISKKGVCCKMGKIVFEGKRKANFARKVKRVDDRSWAAEVGVEVEEQGQKQENCSGKE